MSSTLFFFSSRRRHTRSKRDWSSDVCSSDLYSFPLQVFVLPGKDGYSRAIVQGYHKNFAPRAGFAYSASKRLVVRAGYGIFYGLRDQNDQTTIRSEERRVGKECRAEWGR